jgi:hypothetical protein
VTRLWRDHSLSIVLAALGVGCIAYAFRHEEGQWFDLWLGLGQSTLTVSLFYVLSAWLRERNRPED